MADTDTFVEVGVFESKWRPLSEFERNDAADLLAAASRIIRRKSTKPIDEDDARTVVTSVVRDAMTSGSMRGHSSYTKAVGPRSRAGTLTNPDGELRFLKWHCQLLGISFREMPVGHFGDRSDCVDLR
ncbi:hypothetical protein AB0362_13050 [Rhodococcus sp. NPDC079359]|uniref:hypothetical protein n=1 Tax=Rhodococcus sp. NPDC079359 TaxID=3154961 RepID=UPI00344BAC1E